MSIRSEKGFTGIDIAISVIVLFIFISLIAVLIYNFNSSSREVELKSEATYLAVDEIENIKNEGFNKIETISINNGGNPYREGETEEKGFYKKVIIEDYTDIEGNEEEVPNLVKQVTVQISYMFLWKTQTVEITTVITNETN